ncbi:MAG: bifunctional metallophosphatase/5'-nucleotidase [Bacteroidales bacterium]
MNNHPYNKPVKSVVYNIRLLTTGILFLCLTVFPVKGQVTKFTLLSTSDEHSTLVPLPLADYHQHMANPSRGGYARLSTLVSEIREVKEKESVLLFSSGDILGGTPFAWLTLEGFSPEIELMKKIGYNAMTIGNHEFDYGPEMLAGYFVRAGYPSLSDELPLIASNLNIPEGHDLDKAGIVENHIFELPGGIKLGVFGILGESAYSVAGYAEPVTISDQFSAARDQVRVLREAGAMIIVALSHSGISEDRMLANRVEGIDIILGGHDHYLSAKPEIVNRTIIFHPGYNLEYLGQLEFEWNNETSELTLVNERNNTPYHIPVDSSIEEDLRIVEMTDYYMEELNRFISVHSAGMFTDTGSGIIYSDFEMRQNPPFSETTTGNFVTDAMRIIAEEVTGERVDVAVQGNGVIRADIVPGTMEWSAGTVSLFDLVTVTGLGSGPDGKAGYPLVSFYLTAGEIYNVLEISSLLSQLMGDIYFLQVSGLRYRLDPGKAMWLKVPFLGIPVPAYRSVSDIEMYAGQGIQDEENYLKLDKNDQRLYHVVTDHYLTSFLPMVGEVLPRLKLVLKDRDGNPVELENTVISSQGQELKVWEALAMYAASLNIAGQNLPVMPVYYSDISGRIIPEKGIPLRIWSWLAIATVVVLLFFLLRYLIRKIRNISYRRRQTP